jgi:endonuclease I
MKETYVKGVYTMRKLVSLFLLLALLTSLSTSALALKPDFQYSKDANSGIRHQVCTTLHGTSVDSYYTEGYLYDDLMDLPGGELLQTLRAFLTQTHTYQTSYDECRDLSVKTDCENGDGTSINLLYSSFVTDRKGYINDTKKGWNREHVWPKSLGGFNTTGAGADLHHIRPTDSSLNGTRGNLKYGYVTDGKEMYGTVVTGGAHGGKKGNGLMEPLDNAKGDVARICLYVYVRYGGELSKCSSITNVFESIDTLLAWHALDPVDTWEMGRNEVVYGIQGNRNVFIDYPELAWVLFDREVPADIQIPDPRTPGNCPGHQYEEVMVEKQATETENGIRLMTCTVCNQYKQEVIPAWNRCEHELGEWTSNEDFSSAICKICGYTAIEEHAPDLSWVWIIVGVAAVGAAVAVVIVIRKKKQK